MKRNDLSRKYIFFIQKQMYLNTLIFNKSYILFTYTALMFILGRINWYVNRRFYAILKKIKYKEFITTVCIHVYVTFTIKSSLSYLLFY